VHTFVSILLVMTVSFWPQVLCSQAVKDSATARSATATTTIAAAAKIDAGTHSQLTLAKTIAVVPQVASFGSTPQCDSDGNYYVRTDLLAVTKFNSKWEQIATFNAGSSADVAKLDAAGMFTVSADGDVYQLVFPHSLDRDLFLYGKDGSYKSMVKLDVGGPWSPNLFLVFPSGNVLATGGKWVRTAKQYFPFTGILSSNGSLLKELHLEDDENIHNLAASGDSRFSMGGGLNFAISRGKLEIGSDGNAYLLRWLNPAVIYAISPGGEVVRRITIDPGDQELMVDKMTIVGNRIAIVFRKTSPEHRVLQQLIDVVDLEGNKVAIYDQPMSDGHVAFGASLVCYTQNPEQFTFMEWTKDDKWALNVTEPK
jgi:hypothetical protein